MIEGSLTAKEQIQ